MYGRNKVVPVQVVEFGRELIARQQARRGIGLGRGAQGRSKVIPVLLLEWAIFGDVVRPSNRTFEDVKATLPMG